MPSYTSKTNDSAYRIVNLKQSTVGDFTAFTSVDQRIQWGGAWVLEVLRADQTTQIISEDCFSRTWVQTGKKISLNGDVPTGHLWVKVGGVSYKVPSDLPLNGKMQEFLLPDGALQADLFGDAYFEAAIDLQNG